MKILRCYKSSLEVYHIFQLCKTESGILVWRFLRISHTKPDNIVELNSDYDELLPVFDNEGYYEGRRFDGL